MTQARVPLGTGAGLGGPAEYLVDSTQIPTNRTLTEVPGRVNRLENVWERQVKVATDSSGVVDRFIALENGRIQGVEISNGTSTASTGANGWKVVVTNLNNSSGVVGSFGVGTGTNAVAATDHTVVDSSAKVRISNSLVTTTASFNRGDILAVTVTEDGTADDIYVNFVCEARSAGRS
jgi:hypothetical protein